MQGFEYALKRRQASPCAVRQEAKCERAAQEALISSFSEQHKLGQEWIFISSQRVPE